MLETIDLFYCDVLSMSLSTIIGPCFHNFGKQKILMDQFRREILNIIDKQNVVIENQEKTPDV